MKLLVSSNNPQNPLTLDLSSFINVQKGEGMDPYDPAFSEKVFSHSLLREGGVLALEDLKLKEQIFPLLLNLPQVQLVNLVVNPSVEVDTQALGASSTLSRNATDSVFGAACAQCDHAAMAGTTSAIFFGNQSPGTGLNACPVVAGQTYSIRVSGKVVSVASTTITALQARIRWYDAAGATISDTVAFSQANPATGAWFALGGSAAAPANAAFASAGLFIVAAGAGGTVSYRADGALLVKNANVPPYFDGAVDANESNDASATSLSYWTGPPNLSTSVRMGDSTGMARLVQLLNQILTTPGATASWQDDDISEPTVFDLSSGQFDIAYDYRRNQHVWLAGKLRLFAAPFGRKAVPRFYAAASGVGPLLMISPYASGGANILGASNQGGLSGFGGQQQPSGGVFFGGSPALTGDAPAQLQISYVGPGTPSSSTGGAVPYVAVSLLPDPLYRPLITAPELTKGRTNIASAALVARADAAGTASQVLFLWANGLIGETIYTFKPLPVPSSIEPSTIYGDQRLLVIARASMIGVPTPYFAPVISTVGGPLVRNPATASVALNLDWGVYDLGVISLRPSNVPMAPVTLVTAQGGAAGTGTPSTSALEIAGLLMLPENSTWFLNPRGVVAAASQYGYPSELFQINTQGVGNRGASAPFTNTILIDDTLADQFLYAGASQTFAPSPIGMAASSARITPWTRGAVPRPDPRNGYPIIAIVGVGPGSAPSQIYQDLVGNYYAVSGASWANPQNLRSMAQVNVVERTRYILG